MLGRAGVKRACKSGVLGGMSHRCPMCVTSLPGTEGVTLLYLPDGARHPAAGGRCIALGDTGKKAARGWKSPTFLRTVCHTQPAHTFHLCGPPRRNSSSPAVPLRMPPIIAPVCLEPPLSEPPSGSGSGSGSRTPSAATGGGGNGCGGDDGGGDGGDEGGGDCGDGPLAQ